MSGSDASRSLIPGSGPRKVATMRATKKKAAAKKTAAAKKAKPNVVRSSDYMGSKIEVIAKGAGQEVQVDGNPIATSRDADTGAYICSDAPYVHYGSLEEVAQAVVEVKKQG